jgi:beta-lactamase class A
MTPDAFLAQLPRGITWSVDVRHHASPAPLLQVGQNQVCATASIGKLLLLIAAAEALEAGDLHPDRPCARSRLAPVADSGLWQHLRTDAVTVADLCVLVGATSDNVATNALITVVGLDAANAVGARLGLVHTLLCDIVRETRPPDVPPALSTGTAAELRLLMDELDRGDRIDRAAAVRVIGWLSNNCDLSMVASAFGLDPLAHADIDRGIRLWNKTGTNHGVRCDVGLVRSGFSAVSYAVLANWQPEGPSDPNRDHILDAMRGIGELIRTTLEDGPAP